MAFPGVAVVLVSDVPMAERFDQQIRLTAGHHGVDLALKDSNRVHNPVHAVQGRPLAIKLCRLQQAEGPWDLD